MQTATAPAKINWFLKVTGRRPDGYHNIFTLMQKIDLRDELSFYPSEGIQVKNSLGIAQERDLVFRAATLLRQSCETDSGIRIEIKKTIPPEAGLGGGSSNGATALTTLNALWDLDLTESELMCIGSGLGSDVPFFVQPSPLALVEAKGEVVRPVPAPSSGLTLVIVKPPSGVPTKRAYALVEEYSEPSYCAELLERTREALERGDLAGLSGCLENDLEGPAFRILPQLRDLKEQLLNTGAIGALVSGSGSSVFGLFEDRKRAIRASKGFRNCEVFVVETL